MQLNGVIELMDYLKSLIELCAQSELVEEIELREEIEIIELIELVEKLQVLELIKVSEWNHWVLITDIEEVELIG